MIYLINYRDTFPEHITPINVTSHSTNWSKGLSPFFIGPVTLYGEYWARNMENAWQYCKVYPEHVKNDVIQSSYWQWALAGWASGYARRYPMGKGKKPLFSLWDNERLSYIEARKAIYIPLYAKAVVKSEAFAQLKELYKTQDEIWLLDFDTYRHDLLGYTFDDCINDPARTLGHGFIIAMLLTGYLKGYENER